MSFEDYRRNILDFEYFDDLSKGSYPERIGEPDELSSCIGLISIAYQILEDKISEGIGRLMQVTPTVSNIVTAELTAKTKLDIFFSLIRELNEQYFFNRLHGDGFEKYYLKEFKKALSKCSELRNKVIHASFVTCPHTKRIKRLKKTSKAKSGLVETRESIEIPHLLNIYDFIVSMTMEIDDFFIDFKKDEHLSIPKPKS